MEPSSLRFCSACSGEMNEEATRAVTLSPRLVGSKRIPAIESWLWTRVNGLSNSMTK